MSTSSQKPDNVPHPIWFRVALFALVLGVVLSGCFIFSWLHATLTSKWQARRQVRTSAEIDQLHAAAQRFHDKYTFYPPSQMKLCERFSDYGNTELDKRSKWVLGRMFPRYCRPGSKTPPVVVDWDGNGRYSPPVILTGDQCLVFFLSGINGRGFSQDVRDPGNRAVPWDPPFYNFAADRLVDLRGNGFPSYLDLYRQRPYAYFSSPYKGYNEWPVLGGHPSDCPSEPGKAMGDSDVWPYASAPNTYLNPDTFQILSAGPDGVFGTGSPNGASNFLSVGTGSKLPPAARDDLANFSAGPLGRY
jgi:hypothetical protein